MKLSSLFLLTYTHVMILMAGVGIIYHIKDSLIMEHPKPSQQVLAVALCKKLSQADSYYSWSLQAGEDARLLSQAKTIYQEFFHKKGGRVPRLALIVEKARLGLLLVELSPEEQRDETAESTLAMYLEFDEQSAVPVFQTVAALLYGYDNKLYPEYLQHFRAYSRQFAGAGQQHSVPQAPALELPQCPQENDGEHTFLSSEVALPSIRHNRRKCACYLRKLSESEEFPGSLILISAGRVTIETLQQFADDYSLGKLIVLTLSATVQDELDLRSPAERYIPETIRERITMNIKKLFSKG